jgi:hypothetical protein
LKGFPGSDIEVKQLADELWSREAMLSRQSAREVLLRQGIKPDFEWAHLGEPKPEVDYIHRSDQGAEIYFVANRSTNAAALSCTFRVAGKAPELWDAVSGGHRFAAAYAQADGRTTLPLQLPPCGSLFVIFREQAKTHPASASRNGSEYKLLTELDGSWSVSFDPKWGGPESAQFETLASWATRSESGIKFYSGKAVYRKSFELPPDAGGQSTWLNLGEVRELAEVKVNGRSCGVLWAPPFQAEISRALKPGRNELEVEVVNFWPNRIIGDQSLPEAQRITRTNIRKLTTDTPLMKSGLLGPVRLEVLQP